MNRIKSETFLRREGGSSILWEEKVESMVFGGLERERRARRMERKIGRAAEMFEFDAWCIARAVVAVKRFSVGRAVPDDIFRV